MTVTLSDEIKEMVEKLRECTPEEREEMLSGLSPYQRGILDALINERFVGGDNAK